MTCDLPACMFKEQTMVPVTGKRSFMLCLHIPVVKTQIIKYISKASGKTGAVSSCFPVRDQEKIQTHNQFLWKLFCTPDK